jgi:hypothetical protein
MGAIAAGVNPISATTRLIPRRSQSAVFTLKIWAKGTFGQQLHTATAGQLAS